MKTQVPCARTPPLPRSISDSVGLTWGQEFASLTTSQVIQRLLGRGARSGGDREGTKGTWLLGAFPLGCPHFSKVRLE